MHFRRWGPCLLASLALAAPLRAQAEAPTYRIRLYEPWSLRIAPVLRAPLADRMADSLPLTNTEGRTFLVPRRHVMQIDSLIRVIPAGERTRRGAVDGVITGALVGAIFGALTYQESGRSRFANAGVYGLGFATGGSLLGAGIGRLRSGEVWESVWPPRP